ncbi:MAG: C39 family peptidase [Chloroflexi bacterium]|nr:C39 family peptidase [Chloroflexota bacterium]
MIRLSKSIPLAYQGHGNNCGPCSIAMALNFYLHEPTTPQDVAGDIWRWRVPWIGATLTQGVAHGVRKRGMVPRGGWFGALNTLKLHLDADRPVIVLVRPTDLSGVPFYALHYRVVVGYNDRSGLPGGGELYFNCSASPPTAGEADHPGNVVVGYARFRSQWLTWASINWYTAVYPGEELFA